MQAAFKSPKSSLHMNHRLFQKPRLQRLHARINHLPCRFIQRKPRRIIRPHFHQTDQITLQINRRQLNIRIFRQPALCLAQLQRAGNLPAAHRMIMPSQFGQRLVTFRLLAFQKHDLAKFPLLLVFFQQAEQIEQALAQMLPHIGGIV